MALDVGACAPLPEAIARYFPAEIPMRRCGVHATGSCFFASLAHALDVDDYHRRSDADKRRIGHNLRTRIRRRLREGGAEGWRAFWKQRGVSEPPPLKEVDRKMKDLGEWADVWAIVFAAHVLTINVLFFDLDAGRMYCGVGDFGFPQTVLIAWVERSHFEPIEGGTPPRTHFTARHPVMKRVRGGYAGECAGVRLSDVVHNDE